MINIKNPDPSKTKMHQISYNVLIYHTGYVTVKTFSYIAINSVNPLYLFINIVNGYIEENDGNKYLTLVPTDESKTY